VLFGQDYTFGKYEVIDVIDDWDLGFDLGNAVKYIARAGKKDPKKTVEDLEKALFYINDKIKRIKKKKEGAKGCPLCLHPISAHGASTGVLSGFGSCTISVMNKDGKSVRCRCEGH
jgi:hypothetical protein